LQLTKHTPEAGVLTVSLVCHRG